MSKDCLNKGISTPLAIYVIIILALIVGGSTYLLYVTSQDYQGYQAEIAPEEEVKPPEIEIPEIKKKIIEICFGSCSITNEKIAIWTDFNDEAGKLKEDLFLIKIPERETIKINKEPAHILSTALSGEKVVWVESRDDYDNWEMHIYDIKTGRQRKLMPIRVREYHEYKGRIVLKKTVNDFDSNHKLLIYDINRGEMTELFDTPTGYSCFVGQKNKIIFREKGKFYLYDLDTDKREALPEELNDSASCLDIYEDNIVYSKFTGPKGEEKESLKDDPNIEIHGDVIGMGPDWYVDIDDPDSGLKIFAYNLSTRKTKELKEITVPKVVFGSFMSMGVNGLRIIKNEVKYLMSVHRWVGPDIDDSTTKCFVIDIDTGEEEDVTCKGGISPW